MLSEAAVGARLLHRYSDPKQTPSCYCFFHPNRSIAPQLEEHSVLWHTNGSGKDYSWLWDLSFTLCVCVCLCVYKTRLCLDASTGTCRMCSKNIFPTVSKQWKKCVNGNSNSSCTSQALQIVREEKCGGSGKKSIAATDAPSWRIERHAKGVACETRGLSQLNQIGSTFTKTFSADHLLVSIALKGNLNVYTYLMIKGIKGANPRGDDEPSIGDG